VSDADRRSALVVVAIEAEPVVSEWRLRYLRESVERGIPPHLTILFPFAPPAEIGDEMLEALRSLYAPIAGFAYQLVSVEAFSDAAWLAPEPVEPFLELVATTRSAFPAYPPYGDPEYVAVPHCTLGTDEDPVAVDEMVRELRKGLGPRLPIRCHARDVALVGELSNGNWMTRASFPLEGSR